MRKLLALLAALLFAAGCGDDDESDTTGPTGATGAQQAAEGASYDITVGEFIAELQPQKQEILEDFVADTKACRGLEVDNGFVLLVSAAAIDAQQDAPLAALAEDQC
jgi:hypothetical protein